MDLLSLITSPIDGSLPLTLKDAFLALGGCVITSDDETCLTLISISGGASVVVAGVLPPAFLQFLRDVYDESFFTEELLLPENSIS